MPDDQTSKTGWHAAGTAETPPLCLKALHRAALSKAWEQTTIYAVAIQGSAQGQQNPASLHLEGVV